MNTDHAEFRSFPASVKALNTDHPDGEFEVILSTKSVDRDGESVQPGAFNPLPSSIPIFVDHDWRAGAVPVAKAKPFYDGDVLKAAGVFASTARAQELRSLVTGGFVDSMSVGFTNAKRRVVNGQKSVMTAQLFESSFTAIPINVDAKVLAAKAGARNSKTDLEMIQGIHDYATTLGADCEAAKAGAGEATVKAIEGSVEALQARVCDALEDAYGDWATILRGVLPDVVVFDWLSGDGDTYQQSYTDDGQVVTLEGDPVEVDIHEVIAPDADADREENEPGPSLLSVSAKAVSDKPWGDIKESDYTDAAAFCKACLIDLNDGTPKSKSKCKLPVYEPGGALNRAAVHAAAQRIGQVDAPADVLDRAKSKLRRLYSQLDEEPPDSLKSLTAAADEESAAAAEVEEAKARLRLRTVAATH